MRDPPHPGLSVRHDCLEPLNLTVTEAARRLGVSRKHFSELVNCRSGISPLMAIRLDKAFGGGADTWYRLQSAYDLAQAMKREPEKILQTPSAESGGGQKWQTPSAESLLDITRSRSPRTRE